MSKYQVSFPNTNEQFIHFKVFFENCSENTLIFLPRWRPGRYELGNFAKNVKGFKVFDANGKNISFQKEGLSEWRLQNKAGETIRVEYSYYANELNAGSSFLNSEQLYVNPVNCFIYTKESMDLKSEVSLQIPSDWKIACSLKQEATTLFANDYHELADSPFICSANLKHHQYEVNETIFHLWFNGIKEVNWELVLRDFSKFTQKQMEKFIEFPVLEYHFLFQIVPTHAYHGVEHTSSTVILLGPEYAIFKERYIDLLGVSSHELYHTWNVKTIRPIEMFPYDYQKENLSRLGYLCEGITTYQGDLMLYKSGVFSFEQYKTEIEAQLQKHFDNFGRFSYSVAESSFDTWLDGYTPGVPGRKVSIYTEGCLLAFVLDIQIRKFSNNKQGLDEFMKRLYFNFALEGKGVSEENFQDLALQMAGEGMKSIFNDYFYGSRPFEGLLSEAFEEIGLELKQAVSSVYSHGRLGFKTLPNGTHFIVKAVFPGSPAELGGLQLEDEIIAVNNRNVNGALDQWLHYFDDELKEITLFRAGKLIRLVLPEVQRNFYSIYSLEKELNPNGAQKIAFEHWSK